MPPSTSHDHVARARAGDTGALKLIIDAHGAAMYRVGFRLTRDHHAAEDVVQDALVRLLDDGTALPTANATRRWLLRVTRNLAISHIRRTSAAGRAVTHRAQLIDLTVESPARDVEARVLAAALLSELTERERRMLIRHHVHGEALAVLAAEAATSTDVVKVQLSRARAKARATGRRRDIDGIPWWIPAPLVRLGASAKGATGAVASKAAAAILVPALLLGGTLVSPHVPHSATRDEGTAGPTEGWRFAPIPATTAVASDASFEHGPEPGQTDSSLIANGQGPKGEASTPAPPPRRDAVTGQIEYPLSGQRVEVVEGGPGYSAEDAGPVQEGTQYIVYADVLTDFGFYQGTVYSDDAPQVVATICVVADHVPDEVAYCAIGDGEGGEVEGDG